MEATLINLLIVIIIMCAIIYVIRLLPLPSPFNTIAMVIVAVVFLIYLLRLLPGVL